MAFAPAYQFQWQNPELRKTIYPFRDKKLRDFLLIYEEIDLWKATGAKTVDTSAAAELKTEHERLKAELEKAKQTKLQSEQAVAALRQKHRLLLGSKEIRDLVQKKINLENKLRDQSAIQKSVGRRREWYAQHAPEHPYFEKFTRELEAARAASEQLTTELNGVLSAYNAQLGPFLAESKMQEERLATSVAAIRSLTEAGRKLPALDKSGGISARAAMLWRMQKRERELEKVSHDELLQMVLDRFAKEPLRFPKWLQYMVIHFSGMRYKSAHASWADPRDLLLSLVLEDVRQKIQQMTPAALEQEAARETAALQKQKLATPATGQRMLDTDLAALSNPAKRQATLIKLRSAVTMAEIQRLPAADVLGRLKGYKDQFPEWAWKEVVARTDLRLEVKDENWETLTPQQAQERWKVENSRWREMVDAWARKDITGWRKQHEQTLSLIVSRAVCNEVAEHIQHLRGHKPSGGLTAKPDWYLNAGRKDPARAYFRRPMAVGDFKNGASILFLGWVDRQPNAWQIAKPLPGIELSPPPPAPAKSEKKPVKTGLVNNGQGGLWLRWTHEATVVEVAEMASGTYVLTFETGQIGLNLRPLGRMINNWDIFVGYVPQNPVAPAGLDPMLDRNKILPPPGGVAFDLSFDGASMDDVPGAGEVKRIWEMLTPRQKHVVKLLSQGKTEREVATALDTSPANARRHIRNAMKKFGIGSQDELQILLADWDFSNAGD